VETEGGASTALRELNEADDCGWFGDLFSEYHAQRKELSKQNVHGQRKHESNVLRGDAKRARTFGEDSKVFVDNDENASANSKSDSKIMQIQKKRARTTMPKAVGGDGKCISMLTDLDPTKSTTTSIISKILDFPSRTRWNRHSLSQRIM
jgi:hypothetical protein